MNAQEKRKCRKITKEAIKDKIIEPLKKCENCGNKNSGISIHHMNYKNPYDIKFVCQDCHTKEDHLRLKVYKNTINSVVIRRELIQKRNLLIVQLGKQGYNSNHLGMIFNIAHTTALRVIQNNKKFK